MLKFLAFSLVNKETRSGYLLSNLRSQFVEKISFRNPKEGCFKITRLSSRIYTGSNNTQESFGKIQDYLVALYIC